MDEVIGLRLTQAERQALDRQRGKQTVSGYIRRLIHDDGKVHKGEIDMFREFCEKLKNIEEVLVHPGGLSQPQADLVTRLDALSRRIDALAKGVILRSDKLAEYERACVDHRE